MQGAIMIIAFVKRNMGIEVRLYRVNFTSSYKIVIFSLTYFKQ